MDARILADERAEIVLHDAPRVLVGGAHVRVGQALAAEILRLEHAEVLGVLGKQVARQEFRQAMVADFEAQPHLFGQLAIRQLVRQGIEAQLRVKAQPLVHGVILNVQALPEDAAIRETRGQHRCAAGHGARAVQRRPFTVFAGQEEEVAETLRQVIHAVEQPFGSVGADQHTFRRHRELIPIPGVGCRDGVGRLNGGLRSEIQRHALVRAFAHRAGHPHTCEQAHKLRDGIRLAAISASGRQQQDISGKEKRSHGG
jgi:hypothetical protein